MTAGDKQSFLGPWPDAWMTPIPSSSWSQLQGPSLAGDQDTARVKATSSQDGSHIIAATPLTTFMDSVHTKLIYMSLKAKHSQKVNIPKSITCLCSMGSVRSGAPKDSATPVPPTRRFGGTEMTPTNLYRPQQSLCTPELCECFLMRMAF